MYTTGAETGFCRDCSPISDVSVSPGHHLAITPSVDYAGALPDYPTNGSFPV